MTTRHVPHLPTPGMVCVSKTHVVYAHGPCLYLFDEIDAAFHDVLFQSITPTAKVTAVVASHEEEILCAFDNGDVVCISSDTTRHVCHLYLTPYTFTHLGDAGSCWVGIAGNGTSLIAICKTTKVCTVTETRKSMTHLETFGVATFVIVDDGVMYVATMDGGGGYHSASMVSPLHRVETFASMETGGVSNAHDTGALTIQPSTMVPSAAQNTVMRIVRVVSNERLRRSEGVCPGAILATTACGKLLLMEFTQNRLFKPLSKIL